MNVQIVQTPRTRNQDTLVADGFEGVSCESVRHGNGKWEHVLIIHVAGCGSRSEHVFKLKLPASAMLEVRDALAMAYAGVVEIDDYRQSHYLSGSDIRYTKCGLPVTKSLTVVDRFASCKRCATPRETPYARE